MLGIFDDPLVLLEIRKLMFYAIITEVIKLIIKKTTTTNIKTDSINIKINFFFLRFYLLNVAKEKWHCNYSFWSLFQFFLNKTISVQTAMLSS